VSRSGESSLHGAGLCNHLSCKFKAGTSERWDAKGRQKPTVEVLAFLLPSVGSHWKVLSRFRTPLTVSTVAAHRSGGLGGDGIGSWESDSRESRGRCHHLGLLASASRACRNWECPRMPACGGPTAQVWPTAEELD
jgi:hypothetical protein